MTAYHIWTDQFKNMVTMPTKWFYQQNLVHNMEIRENKLTQKKKEQILPTVHFRSFIMMYWPLCQILFLLFTQFLDNKWKDFNQIL